MLSKMNTAFILSLVALWATITESAVLKAQNGKSLESHSSIEAAGRNKRQAHLRYNRDYGGGWSSSKYFNSASQAGRRFRISALYDRSPIAGTSGSTLLGNKGSLWGRRSQTPWNLRGQLGDRSYPSWYYRDHYGSRQSSPTRWNNRRQHMDWGRGGSGGVRGGQYTNGSIFGK